MTTKLKYYVSQWKKGVIHKSMYDAYDFCPGSFQLQYERGVPASPSLAANIGLEFHSFVEGFFRRDIKSNALISLEKYKDIVDYFQMCVPVNAPNILKLFMGRFCIYQAKRYYHTCMLYDDPIRIFYPVEVELQLESEIEHNGRSYMMGGTIDALFNYINDKTEEIEGYCITDWKTGKKHRHTKFRRANAQYKELVDNDSTLEFKALRQEIYNPRVDDGVFWDEAEVKRDFMYIPCGMYGKFIEKSRKAMFNMIDKLELATENGITEDDYKVNQYNCPHCSYLEVCPARKKDDTIVRRLYRTEVGRQCHD